ncbi:MAG: LolA family protein, partial [Planctomycetota bacterium]
MVLVLLLASFTAAPLNAGEPSDPLDELVKRQEGLRSVKATFTQESYDLLLGRPIKSSGNFYFRTEKGVRWEYEDALVVYDGSVLYVYS